MEHSLRSSLHRIFFALQTRARKALRKARALSPGRRAAVAGMVAVIIGALAQNRSETRIRSHLLREMQPPLALIDALTSIARFTRQSGALKRKKLPALAQAALPTNATDAQAKHFWKGSEPGLLLVGDLENDEWILFKSAASKNSEKSQLPRHWDYLGANWQGIQAWIENSQRERSQKKVAVGVEKTAVRHNPKEIVY